MMLLLALLGCSNSDEDTAVQRPVPEISTQNCGGPAYDWADMEAVGQLVSWEPLLEGTIGPAGIEALQESTDQNIVDNVPYGAKTYRFRYTTQDRGAIIEATGMVAFPDTQGEPLETQSLLWMHPTVGFSDSCAPSANGIEQMVPLLVGASQGYIVVAPDYLGMAGFGEPSGMLHPYVVSEPTAVVSLDAVRAMEQLATLSRGPELGVVPNNELVMWGISEGGFGALWAARYLPHYAPEYELLGVAAIIPASDMLALAQHGLSTFGDTSWAIMAVLATAHPWFGEAGDLSEALTDEEPAFLASRLPEILQTECEPTDFEGAEQLTEVGHLFQADFIEAVVSGDWASADPFSCYLASSTLPGSEIPRVDDSPTLVIVGENDTLAYAGTERASVEKLCEEGQAIEYIECSGAGHVTAAVESLSYQWQWLSRRLQKQEWADGGTCDTSVRVACTELMD